MKWFKELIRDLPWMEIITVIAIVIVVILVLFSCGQLAILQRTVTDSLEISNPRLPKEKTIK